MLAVRSLGSSAPSVIRVRSASFTGHIAGRETAALAPLQHQSRTICSSSRLTERSGSERLALITAARSRPRRASNARQPWKGLRLASSLHRLDCKWVRTSGDSQNAVRDRECSQCTKEQEMTEELSQREVMWQKHVEFWREFIEKDPYDALFGRSNNMLRGKVWAPRYTWAQDVRGQVLDGKSLTQEKRPTVKRERVQDGRSRNSSNTSSTPIQNITMTNTQSLATHIQAPPREHSVEKEIPVKKAPTEEDRPNEPVPGYAAWGHRSMKGRGQTIQEAKGKLVFDPISMRMVPAEKEPLDNDNTSKSWTETGQRIHAKMAANNTSPTLWIDEAFDSDGQKCVKSSNGELSAEHCNPREGSARESGAIYEATKRALECSWRHESVAKGPVVDASDVPGAKTAAKSSSIPHFRQMPGKEPSVASANKLLGRRKEKGFKQMTSRELEQHRAALLGLWARRHGSKTESPPGRALERLEHEIDSIKQSYATFERKSRTKHLPSIEPASSASPNKPRTQDISAVAGEGDLCPNAANFTSSDRWYKRPAPHASVDKQYKFSDRQLVVDIRTIYENAYGIIDENHRQGDNLERNLKRYEDKLEAKPYSFQGELRNNRVPTDIETCRQRVTLESSLKRYEDRLDMKPHASKDNKTHAPIASGSKCIQAMNEFKKDGPDKALARLNSVRVLMRKTSWKARELRNELQHLRCQRDTFQSEPADAPRDSEAPFQPNSRHARLSVTLRRIRETESELSQVEQQLDALRNTYTKAVHRVNDISHSDQHTSLHTMICRMDETERALQSVRLELCGLQLARLVRYPEVGKDSSPCTEKDSPWNALESVEKRTRKILAILSKKNDSEPTPKSPMVDQVGLSDRVSTSAPEQYLGSSTSTNHFNLNSSGLVHCEDQSLCPPPKTQIGNFASPTGFYHELQDEPASSSQKASPKARSQVSKSNPRMRREEAVFSGTKGNKGGWSSATQSQANSEDRGNHKRGRGTDKRKRGIFMQTLISAAIIGAFCYCSGVTIELLRASKSNVDGVQASNDSQDKNSTYKASEGWLAVRRQVDETPAIFSPNGQVQSLGADASMTLSVARWIVLGGVVWATIRVLSGGGN